MTKICTKGRGAYYQVKNEPSLMLKNICLDKTQIQTHQRYIYLVIFCLFMGSFFFTINFMKVYVPFTCYVSGSINTYHSHGVIIDVF